MLYAEAMIASAKKLRDSVDTLTFSNPVTHVYNPLNYAWAAHEMYLKKYANSKKSIIFLGMNPGPWGMAQIGVPFGEISLIQNWLDISTPINKPPLEHPKRPIEGFNCKRSEVSGKRLWGLFKERFVKPEQFFQNHFVANYCPLVFMESSGSNRTPDKLPSAEAQPLYSFCDEHLKEIVDILSPTWVIGIGAFAENRARHALHNKNVQIGHILHPSPASPAANKNWAEKASQQLINLCIW